MRVVQRVSLTAASLLLVGAVSFAFAQGAGGGAGIGTSGAGTGLDAGSATGGRSSGDLGGTVGAPTVDDSGTASGATNVGPNGKSGEASLDGTAKSELPASPGTSSTTNMRQGLNPGASFGGDAAGSLNAPSPGAASGNVGATLGR
jgi:hypothetical protein